jgi:RNA polymerase sigma-B factor
LNVTTERRLGWVVVTPSGEIDLDTIDDFARVLIEVTLDQPEALAVDMSDVSFWDTTALRVLIETHQQQMKHDGDFVLVVPPGPFADVVEEAKLGDDIPTYRTLEEAAAAKTGRPPRRGGPGKPTEITHTRVRPDTGAAAAARRFVRSRVSGLDAVRKLEAELLVSEVVTNALIDNIVNPNDRISIEAERGPGTLRFTVRSAGPPLEETIPGYSVQLLEKLSRAWGHEYHDGRLSVWFELRRPGAALELGDLDDLETLERAKIDEAAKAEVFKRYQPLVSKLSSEFRGKMAEAEDLEQVAAMALLGAIERFDSAAGSFPAFASVTITGELKRHLRDRGWSVRVPRSLQDAALVVGRAKLDLSQTLQRAPTIEEIGLETGLSPEKVLEAEEAGAAYRADSLNAPVSEADSEVELIDRLGDPDGNINRVEQWQDLELVINELPERDRTVLFLRFFEDKTQSEIATDLGISQMHVSRILSRSIKSLRHLLSERATGAS